MVPGANALMTPEGAISALKGMAEYQVVVGQLEIPQEVTLAAFQQGRKDGAITILNPAPYQELLPDLVAASDWIVPNETVRSFSTYLEIQGSLFVFDSCSSLFQTTHCRERNTSHLGRNHLY